MLRSGGVWFLPRLVGLAKAFEILYFGDNVPTQEAERIGMVNKVVPDSELSRATAELATRLVKMPAAATQLLKHSVYVGPENDLLKTLQHITYFRQVQSQSPDAGEGARAFAEKREPVFKSKSLP